MTMLWGYRVVIETGDLLAFERRVSSRIEEGWVCVDGFRVTIDEVSGHRTYYQPMVDRG